MYKLNQKTNYKLEKGFAIYVIDNCYFFFLIGE